MSKHPSTGNLSVYNVPPSQIDHWAQQTTKFQNLAVKGESRQAAPRLTYLGHGWVSQPYFSATPTGAISAQQLQLDFQRSSGLVQRAKQRLMAHGSEIEVGGYRQMGNWWVRIDPDNHNFIFSGGQSRWIDRVTILSDDALGVLLKNETRRRGE